LKSRDCPRVHYVAPTIWAWRAGRVRKFRRHFDHLLALFPFEPPLFDAAGLTSTFVGHPVAEGDVDAGDGAAFRAQHGISSDATMLCVLPGSRRGEVSRLAPVARQSLARVMTDHPGVTLVIPAAEHVRELIEETVADWPWPVLVVDGAQERYDAFAAADLALATSGTVTLELSWAAVPTIVMYRVPWLTGEIIRRMVRVRFVSIVNIVADREVLPEFIQSHCRPKLIADALRALLTDPKRRAKLGAEARQISRDMELGGERPGMRAACAVLDIVAAFRNR
jgi:lipid-A-disaccharide synthase